MRWPAALGLVVAAQLALLLLVFTQSYEGRVNVVDSQRQACARGKLDRGVNANAWQAALQARRATAEDPSVPAEQRASAARAAHIYAVTVASLRARQRIDCARAFPAASPLP